MQIKRMAVKGNVAAAPFEITRRHSAGCVGVQLPERDWVKRYKLTVSIMEMFA